MGPASADGQDRPAKRSASSSARAARPSRPSRRKPAHRSTSRTTARFSSAPWTGRGRKVPRHRRGDDRRGESRQDLHRPHRQHQGLRRVRRDRPRNRRPMSRQRAVQPLRQIASPMWCNMGDEVQVKVILIDDQGRIKLSRKAAMQEMGIKEPEPVGSGRRRGTRGSARRAPRRRRSRFHPRRR